MRKILYIAVREFSATVMTKGFVVGMLFTPALLALVLYFIPRTAFKAPPKIEGEVAIIDPTGAVTDGLAAYLAPERFAERRARDRRQVEAMTPSMVRQQVAARGGDEAMRQSIDAALGEVPQLHVASLPVGSDVEQAKAPLRTVQPKRGADPSARLVLVVVHPDAVRGDEGKALGSYDLFVRGKLDDRLVSDIQGGLREAIVSARLQASGLDPARITALTLVRRPEVRSVTAEGERATSEAFNLMIPMGFMLLLMMSVMTSGQYLLTTTVEEKSNRVVEVLLSAVSAMELMTGKIIGQMAVGFLVLAIYSGLGLLALFSFATLGLLDPMLIVYLLVFYVLASFTYSALLAAIGAAVNEMREAQTLQMPVMMFVIVPWVLWMPISRDPNSAMAVALSFIPPVNNFVMLLRLASTSPPPMWQTLTSILISAAGVYAALWFAAKVFRVGLLMFGKPPTFGTLVRWARMS
jgi:ABC-2 type transport system permease protein